MGETLLGLKGKGFALVVADSHTATSIISLKDDEDKIRIIDDTLLIAAAGPCADRMGFCEYIEKNMHFYRLKNGITLNTAEAASFIRRELANSLRSRSPFQTDLLVAGYDKDEKDASLYFMDYLSSSAKLGKAAHGYGAYFCLGLMDRYWHPDLTEKEAREIIKKCIEEIRVRLVLDITKFTIKIVDKDGWREIKQADL